MQKKKKLRERGAAGEFPLFLPRARILPFLDGEQIT